MPSRLAANAWVIGTCFVARGTCVEPILSLETFRWAIALSRADFSLPPKYFLRSPSVMPILFHMEFSIIFHFHVNT